MIGKYAVGYHIHQVNYEDGIFENHMPIKNIYGHLISFASFFKYWSSGRIKKAPVTVSDSNAELLQFLDGVSQIEKYTEYPMEETINRLLAYAKKMQFKRDQLSEVSTALTGATAKKMIDWGMIYEFTS